MWLVPSQSTWLTQISGPPGVGKTLTAETLAETHKMPLYAVRPSDGSFMGLADRSGSCWTDRRRACHSGSDVDDDFQGCQPLEGHLAD